jgi:phthiodiolone/phenolphthiodiolone dimycocerosates ketoreductase
MPTESSSFETSLVMWGDRNAPASVAAQTARAIEASGVVDRLALSDQLLNFFPRPLWKPEIMPMASVLPDPDSIQEAWTTAGYILHAAPSMGLTLLSDSIRRGPALFVQAMMTLANMTEGRAMFQIGAGEVKNITPYGYKRRGLGMMEDLFRIYREVIESQGEPFDFEGKFTTIKQATLGGAQQFKPQLWALGEGRQLIENATSWADGISSVAPVKYQTADDIIARREKVQRMLIDKDRDPDTFGFGMLAACLIHPDENVIDRALENPAIKWFSGISGRIGAENWRKAGVASPVPEDWNYYAHMKPYATPDSFVEDVITKTTRKHCELAWIHGTPDQVAEQLSAVVDAGVDWLGIVDYMPSLLPLEEAGGAFENSIDVFRQLKARTPAGAAS